MDIDIKDFIASYEAKKAKLDSAKTCKTCKHSCSPAENEPCNNCYNELIGMPVNPTGWEPIGDK